MFIRPSSAKARLVLSCALVLFLLTHAAIAPAALALQEGTISVPDGTEFTVVTTEAIDSKTAAEGDPLSFKVEDDVKIGGKTVIAKGTLVKGVVSTASKSGRMGKAGQLSIRVESTMTVDNQKVKLRASKGKDGDDKTGTTVALVVLFGPLGFLKKGKNAKIKEGTQIKVFTDEEKTVRA